MEDTQTGIGFWRAIGLVIAQALLSVAILVPLVSISRQPTYFALAASLSSLAAYLIAVARWRRAPLSQTIPFRFVPAAVLLTVALMATGWICVEVSLFQWVQNLIPLLYQKLARLETSHQDDHPLVLILAIALLAPIGEELFFRGLLLSRMQRRYSAGVSLALVSIIFTLLHPNPLKWPTILCFAMFAGWLRLRTGSLLPPIVLHIVNNTIAATAYLANGRSVTFNNPYPWTVAFAGMALLAAGAWALRFTLRAVPQPVEEPLAVSEPPAPLDPEPSPQPAIP